MINPRHGKLGLDVLLTVMKCLVKEILHSVGIEKLHTNNYHMYERLA